MTGKDIKEAVKELKEYFSSEYGIEYVFELKRKLDFDIMKKVDTKTNDPDTYWQTKVYFNETLRYLEDLTQHVDY